MQATVSLQLWSMNMQHIGDWCVDNTADDAENVLDCICVCGHSILHHLVEYVPAPVLTGVKHV